MLPREHPEDDCRAEDAQHLALCQQDQEDAPCERAGLLDLWRHLLHRRSLRYLAYGNKIGANLLDNFSQDQAWYLNIVKCAYGIVMLFSYPVLSYAALVTFDKLCFKQPRPAARRYAEAFVWTAISTFIAIVLPDLDTIFGITGSLAVFC